MSIINGDVDSVSSSVPSSRPGSAPGTPRNRVKFLCSHGGKILPRPADGNLKYVGGETRVICLNRDVTFSELMKKLTSMFDGEMILKYQLIPEDFDVLVTVKSDEDVRHMIEECDRHEYLGAPRLRAFLFPANPIVVMNHLGPMDNHSIEQRYINFINGIVVHPSTIYSTFRPFPVNTSYTTYSNSSACSSPRTPPETTSTATNSTSATIATGCMYPELTPCHGKPSTSLTRNHSSSSLCNLGCNSVTNHQNAIVPASPNLNHIHNQQPPQPHHFHPHLHPQFQPQPHQTPKPPLDRHPHKAPGPEHLGKTRSTVGEYYRHHMDPQNSRTNRGGHMYYQRGSPYDDYYGNCSYERTHSPPSPSVLSPSPSFRLGR